MTTVSIIMLLWGVYLSFMGSGNAYTWIVGGIIMAACAEINRKIK